MSEKKPVQRQNITPIDLSGILKDAPPGSWAAMSHDQTRLVASGNSIREAVDLARLNGESNPVLIRTPFAEEGITAGVK
jgi:hypothetical protein